MKKKWKIVLGSMIAVVILGMILLESTKPLEVNLLKIQPRSIAKTFKEEGKVIAANESPIYTHSGGKVLRLPFEEGEKVKKGDSLIAFDSQELSFQLAQLKAQLKSVDSEQKTQKLQYEQAQQDLNTKTLHFNRMEQLHEEGVISQNDYETAQNELNAAKNALQQQSDSFQYYTGQKENLAAQINLTQHQMQEHHLSAPADGIIAELSVKKGMVIEPGSQVMTLFQNDAYHIEVYVLTEDVTNLKPGMKIELIQDNSNIDTLFSGTIEKIAPSAVEKQSTLGLIEQRIKVTVKPVIPKTLTLRPGYAIDVQFTTHQEENRLVVPKTALFPYENSDALWVIRERRAMIQPVQKGFENQQDVVIIEGLKTGDFVILNPQQEELAEGKKVTQKK